MANSIGENGLYEGWQ